MRDVFVLLRDTTEVAVSEYLDSAYPSQREPWVALSNGDTYLYIDLSSADPLDFEPEDWAKVVHRLGGDPQVGVVASVSGRHPGDEQVAEFVSGLLSRFSGGAMDDYTSYLWLLDEIQNGHQVQGHPFFDYKGWYEEDKERE